ncbi:MAG: RagB/SusD family nutrient uptake outer membrane protein [Bacteroidales bacterium]|nr:RagB/SusD family nutrient uptake outer membrane protein [Bacteroidales bacterium]
MGKYIRISTIFMAAMSLAACSFLDLKPNIISSETYYESMKEVQSGLVGIYGVMNNEAFYGNYYSLMLSNVDDLSYYNRTTTPNQLTLWYKHDASASEIYDAWQLIYKGIRNANAFMEAIEDSEFDPDHTLYQEARFMRAYYHFILAQAWGNVPLKTESTKTPDDVMGKATPQEEVLDWVIKEMDATLEYLPEDLANAPSRITRDAANGILARVCLFMAGESVSAGEKTKKEYFKLASDYAYAVISTNRHHLNKEYSNIFINMISDIYDKEYNESMWEADFYGARSGPDTWTNGRIGDVIGLQSSGADDFSNWSCNYSYGMYDGTLKLWDLYLVEDRTEDESELDYITDKRQEWNMPPYNYAGNTSHPPYGSGLTEGVSLASYDKTPYVYDNVSTSNDPLAAPAIRNCGKYRREVEYEGVKTSKSLYTTINYPILRYSDVMLMYAEAVNEYNGTPSQEAYDMVKEIRDRAGIKTKEFSSYSSYEAFRDLVRNERGRELCFESIRKYDLIRWGIFVKTMNEYPKWTNDDRWSKNAKAEYAAAIGTSVQEKHIVLPIPAIELGVNKDLTQNPLW